MYYSTEFASTINSFNLGYESRYSMNMNEYEFKTLMKEQF